MPTEFSERITLGTRKATIQDTTNSMGIIRIVIPTLARIYPDHVVGGSVAFDGKLRWRVFDTTYNTEHGVDSISNTCIPKNTTVLPSL